jgi:hypothetical protein
MKLGKWVLGIAVLGLFLGGSASAQLYGPHQPNELMLHAGTQSWYGGPAGAPFYGYPNAAISKYYPSFSHWAGTSTPGSWGPPAGYVYPWKIDGWAWTTFKLDPSGLGDGNWYWTTTLGKFRDNPYSLTTGTFGGMNWDYPELVCFKLIPKKAIFPGLYGAMMGGTPLAGRTQYQFPSSYGGFNGSWNVFTFFEGSFLVPSGIPTGYLWIQGLAGNCTDPITVPSGYSIWETVWCCRPQVTQSQYLSVDGNEFSCWPTQAATARYGMNYSFINDGDNGWYWGWGTTVEFGTEILVCDIVTLVPNFPGNDGPMNPYAGMFDLGVAMLMPYVLGGCEVLSFFSMANQSVGMLRVTVGDLDGFISPYTGLPWGHGVPYGPANIWRIPHRFGSVMKAMLKNPWIGVFSHQVNAGGPSMLFSTASMGTSAGLGIPPISFLACLTWRWSTVQFAIPAGVRPEIPSGQPAGPHSASFMQTWF